MTLCFTNISTSRRCYLTYNISCLIPVLQRCCRYSKRDSYTLLLDTMSIVCPASASLCDSTDFVHANNKPLDSKGLGSDRTTHHFLRQSLRSFWWRQLHALKVLLYKSSATGRDILNSQPCCIRPQSPECNDSCLHTHSRLFIVHTMEGGRAVCATSRDVRVRLRGSVRKLENQNIIWTLVGLAVPLLA